MTTFDSLYVSCLQYAVLIMDRRDMLDDNFMRVDSIKRNEENVTTNSKEQIFQDTANIKLPVLNTPTPMRRVSIHGSSPISTTRKKKMHRSTLPPKIMGGLADREAFRKKTKHDLHQEWRKEDKMKYELYYAYNKSQRSSVNMTPVEWGTIHLGQRINYSERQFSH